MRIEFQPAILRQIRRVKDSAPFFKTPRASAEPDFLLGREIQGSVWLVIGFCLLESRLEEEVSDDFWFGAPSLFPVVNLTGKVR